MKSVIDRINANTFLTDGGLETDMIFTKNIDLPHFAAFPMLDNPKHIHMLQNYYREYLDIAKKNGTGYILESPTWRANKDWGFKLGYNEQDLFRVNQKAVQCLKELKETYKNDIPDIFISGQIGPRGDGYRIDSTMTQLEARAYHLLQIKAFKMAEVDMVSAITLTYSEEAIGLTLAAQEHDLPIVISLTVETDGNMPNGDSLEDAIYKIDHATNNYPFYYMINCAHPSHFIDVIRSDHNWTSRIKGIRANASCKSHAELDEATELDAGDVVELGQWHAVLNKYLPELRVYGGCCGTDASHVESICKHILKPADSHGI